MSNWTEPKTDYEKKDHVTPDIFNVLGENEKHLKEITCKIELQKTAEIQVINNIVLVEE